MFILKVFILINNQLLNTANAKDFKTDYYSDFRHRNRSNLVEGSLFAIIDLILGVKFITLYIIWRVW